MRAVYAKIIAAGGVVLACVAMSDRAGAEDLGQRFDPPRERVQGITAPSPANDRIEIYTGIIGGGAIASSQHTFVDQSFDTGQFATRGGLLGGTVGFSYTTGSWLLALENDLEWTNANGAFGPTGSAFSTRLDWLYNFRARVGYSFDRFVPYIAFGPSFGGLSSTATIPGVGMQSAQETRSGWTLGAGIDIAISQNWNARVEYLFDCLGSTTQFSIDNIYFMGHFVRAGLNYNIYSSDVRHGDVSGTAAGVAYRWTGIYVGGDVGGSAARLASEYNLAGVPVGSVLDRTNGGFRGIGFHGLAGIEAGYNLQIEHFVLGFETDFQFTQLAGHSVDSRFAVTSGGATGVLTGLTQLSNLGTVRGRLGFAADRWLYYAAGGFAYGGVDTDSKFSTTGAANVASSADSTSAGWTVGAGFEGALWENWTAKFEYLYVDLGTVHDTFASGGAFGSITANSKIAEHVVRAGLNTRFDWFTPR
jgi:outer membrane immunogenic protein